MEYTMTDLEKLHAIVAHHGDDSDKEALRNVEALVAAVHRGEHTMTPVPQSSEISLTERLYDENQALRKELAKKEQEIQVYRSLSGETVDADYEEAVKRREQACAFVSELAAVIAHFRPIIDKGSA
jgi:hypothetical protein